MGDIKELILVGRVSESKLLLIIINIIILIERL